jgi:hypothetical protein
LPLQGGVGEPVKVLGPVRIDSVCCDVVKQQCIDDIDRETLVVRERTSLTVATEKIAETTVSFPVNPKDIGVDRRMINDGLEHLFDEPPGIIIEEIECV